MTRSYRIRAASHDLDLLLARRAVIGIVAQCAAAVETARRLGLPTIVDAVLADSGDRLPLRLLQPRLV